MLELNFEPFPVLETRKLKLRKISMDDADNIFLLRTNNEAMKYIHKTKLNSIEDAKELINKMNEPDRIQWGITLKSTDTIIGTIGYHRIEKENFRAEIGYMLHPQYWGKGIMSEAISVVINYGFREIKLHSIKAVINPENIASKKLLENFKFIQEAYFKENFFFEEKFYDSAVFSLLNKN